jgi:TolB protein
MIAFTTDGRIFTQSLDGSEPQLLVAQSRNNDLTWSPDGTRLAYTSRKNGNTDIYSVTLDGAQTRHSTDPGYDLYPAWSADGKRLAYVSAYEMSYSGFQGDIVVVDVTTNTSTKITNRAAAMPTAPSWSPDGQWITFHGCKIVEDKERCALFIVRSDGSD